MSRGTNPRRANGSRRSKLLARLRASGRPCWICGHAFDPAEAYPSELSMVGDELTPVSRGGSPTDPRNVAPAHRCCNAWRSAKSVEVVGAFRALVAERFGGSSGPVDWCAKARALARCSGAGRAQEPPRTTTKW